MVKSKVSRQAFFLIVMIIPLLSLVYFNVTGQLFTQDSKNNPMLIQSQYRLGDSPLSEDGKLAWLSDTKSEGEWKDFSLSRRIPNSGESQSVWVRGKIPYAGMKEASLVFRAPQQSVEVYLNGERIYQYGEMNWTKGALTPGSKWHFIALSKGYQGNEITIRLTTPIPGYAGLLTETGIGTKSDQIKKIVTARILYVILGFIFLMIGFCSAIVSFTVGVGERGIISLGITTVLFSTWILAQSNFIEILPISPTLRAYIAFVSIFLAPVFFASFLERFFKFEHKWILKKIWQILLALDVIILLLDFTHVISIFKTVTVFHLFLVCSVIVMSVIVTNAAVKGDQEARIVMIGMIVFFVLSINDILVLFYTTSEQKGARLFTHWGMLFFVFLLIYVLGRRFSIINKKLKEHNQDNIINYRSLFENMTDAISYNRIIVDHEGQPIDYEILDMNVEFETISGFKKEELIGKKYKELNFHICEDDPEWMVKVGKVALFGESMRIDQYCTNRDKWYHITIYTPRINYFVLIMDDVTEKKKINQSLEKQAYQDSITNLFNRTFFEAEMVRIGKDLSRYKAVSVFSMDIDGLKIVNDTLGHQTGDRIIIEAAKLIENEFRKTDIVARIGGDEFGVILIDGDSHLVQEKRERIEHAIHLFNQNNPYIPLSISIGAATFGEGDTDIYSVYKRADDHMYQYKLSQAGSLKSKVIDMLMAALSERDYVAQGHIERLVSMAERMGQKLKLSDDEKRNLILLAKVHDLGKIGIPDEILFKAGKLNAEEYKKMKEHVNIGYNIANRSKELSNIATLILNHHEHWDGNGYIQGLSGEQIPLECRIMSINDSYDAMTSERPYSKGISKENAIKEIRRCSGTQFDPSLTESFIEMLNENNI